MPWVRTARRAARAGLLGGEAVNKWIALASGIASALAFAIGERVFSTVLFVLFVASGWAAWEEWAE